VKYTGRIVMTIVVVALIATARIYGYIYYNFPVMELPYIVILAILLCWWLGSQYDKVKFHSEKDVLTEIHNRRFVIQTFPKLLKQIGKRKEKLCLLLIDIDEFKDINDRYGHEMGDNVLQHISKTLLMSTTKLEIVARWAGDEFLVISPYSNENTSGAIIRQIKYALRELSEDININISVSIGASEYPTDAKTLETLIHTSDRNMYENKSRKKIG